MIRRDARRLGWLAGLCMLAGWGCVTEVAPVELGPAGSAHVVFVLPRTGSASTAARVKATASRDEATVSVELEGSGALWQGWLRAIPEGPPALFQVEAFDTAGTRRF